MPYLLRTRCLLASVYVNGFFMISTVVTLYAVPRFGREMNNRR